MENVLQALRNNQIKATSKLVDLLFKCLDALENYTDNIVNTGNEAAMNITISLRNLMISFKRII